MPIWKNFAYPTRFSWLSTLAAKYVTNQVLATASVLSTVVDETCKKRGLLLMATNICSPYISLSIKPFLNYDLRVRVFYKSIFRMPTFNDLYYAQVGERDLKPEKTNQYNFGLTYSTSIDKMASIAGRSLPMLTTTM